MWLFFGKFWLIKNVLNLFIDETAAPLIKPTVNGPHIRFFQLPNKNHCTSAPLTNPVSWYRGNLFLSVCFSVTQYIELSNNLNHWDLSSVASKPPFFSLFHFSI